MRRHFFNSEKWESFNMKTKFFLLSTLMTLASVPSTAFAAEHNNEPPLKDIFLQGMKIDVITTSGINYDYKNSSISSKNPSVLALNLKSESLRKTPFSACTVLASAYLDIAIARYIVRAESMTCTRKIDYSSFSEPIHAFFVDKRDNYQGLKGDQKDHELNLMPNIEALMVFM
jgi:hypothetical protein